MRILIVIGLLFTQINVFPQTSKFFVISGTIVEIKSKLFIPDCHVTLSSKTGLVLETNADKHGVYNIDSIPIENNTIELKVEKQMFFGEKKKFVFSQMPADTTINIELTVVPRNVTWFPEIYFQSNSLTLDSTSLSTIKWFTDFLISNKDLTFKIVGHKDSSETNDYRFDRASLVFNKIANLGGDTSRLKIIVSNKPNILKPNTVVYDYKTKERDEIELSEKYILNSSVEKQDSLRQLNRVVTFELIEK